MRILVSWLRDFVDVSASPEELGHRLSMCGFELGAIEEQEGSDAPSDAVLDFEITANRPDALSVIGIAREAATAYSLPMRRPPVKGLDQNGRADVAVRLEARDLCPRYAAAVADVTVAPSPTWLADRLRAAGVRPINNIVDVTNYVLIEMGQPMHAFDLAKLAGGEIRVRRAQRGERMTTLDGIDRALEAEMLVIADAQKAQAVAGVMGGGLSEVGAATTAIVLESACFNPRSVRRTSKALGLKTEASSRFERGTDIDAPVVGLGRACALLEQIGAGRVRGAIVDEYPEPFESRRVTLRRARIARVLGRGVPDEDVERILHGLGFDFVAIDDGWFAAVPTFRVDVSREVDLIEEVGRHYGYDALPTTFPPLAMPAPPPDPRVARDRLIRRVLLAAGCSEAQTFSFIGDPLVSAFGDEAEVVPIDNPLSAQFSHLRQSLLPGLLAAVAHNRNRQRADVRLFEIGATFARDGETRRVAIAWIGDAGAPHWSAKDRAVDFFDVKGLVERTCEALSVEAAFDGEAIPRYLARGRAASVRYGGQLAGIVGMLAREPLAAAGLSEKDEVYVAELNLDLLGRARSAHLPQFTPLPRFPSIARDISIIIDDVLPAIAVRGTIRSAAPDTLVSVREFDRYQGKGVPDGRVSLSLRLTFRSAERTLTDAEVDGAMKEILAALQRAHDAVQR